MANGKKGSGAGGQPPAELNQRPPTTSVPKGHHAQDKGRAQPTHAGSNTNLSGFGKKK